jgi:hypothetical protein
VKLNMRWWFTLEKENTSALKEANYGTPLPIKTLEK